MFILVLCRSVGPLLLHNRSFPDADFAMENPTSSRIAADNLTPEIAHADIAMPDLRHGKLHDMNAMKPPRHGDAQQFLDQELIMLEECIFAVIRYVLIVIAELIQARKRRTVDTKADTVAWYGADDLTRIALIDCIVVSDDLIDALHIAEHVDRKSTRLNPSH